MQLPWYIICPLHVYMILSPILLNYKVQIQFDVIVLRNLYFEHWVSTDNVLTASCVTNPRYIQRCSSKAGHATFPTISSLLVFNFASIRNILFFYKNMSKQITPPFNKMASDNTCSLYHLYFVHLNTNIGIRIIRMRLLQK